MEIKEYMPTEPALGDHSAMCPRGLAWTESYEDGVRRFHDEVRVLVKLRNLASVVEPPNAQVEFLGRSERFIQNMNWEVGIYNLDVLASGLDERFQIGAFRDFQSV